jgi:hypothetical protein
VRKQKYFKVLFNVLKRRGDAGIISATQTKIEEVVAMRWIVAVAFLATVVLICSIAAGQSKNLPTMEVAAEFAPYVVTAEVVEAQEFDGEKVPWQTVKYKLVKSLYGKFKEKEIKKARKKEDKEKAKEFELMFVQAVQGKDGYALPLPDEFIKKGEKFILFIKTFKDNKDNEKLMAVTPDPATVDLSATEELLKKVKELIKKREKKEKELEKQRKKKSHVNKKPFFKMTKASDDWLIIDLEKVKKEELAVQPTPQAKQSVERYYKDKYCKIFNQKAKAYVLVYSKKHETKATIKDMKTFAEDNIKKMYGEKNVTITSCKAVKVCREVGWAFKYETTTPDGKLKMCRERYVFIRKGQIYDIWMWCPADNYKEMKKDFKKMMDKFRF